MANTGVTGAINATKWKFKDLNETEFLIRPSFLRKLASNLVHNSCTSVQTVLQVYTEIACGISSNTKCA